MLKKELKEEISKEMWNEYQENQQIILVLSDLRENCGTPGLYHFRTALEKIAKTLPESERVIQESLKLIKESVHKSLFDKISFLSQIERQILDRDEHLIATIRDNWIAFLHFFNDKMGYEKISFEVGNLQNVHSRDRAIQILDICWNSNVEISLFLNDIKTLPQSAKLVKDLKKKWDVED